MKGKTKKIIMLIWFLVFIFLFGGMSVYKLIEAKRENKTQAANSPAGFENDFKSNLFMKTDIINTHGKTQEIIGNRVVEDAEVGSVVKTNWNQLTSLPEQDNLDEFKNTLNIITDACAEGEIPAVYLQAPFKILPGFEAEQLPAGLKTYANENADSVIEMLKDKGVDVFDLRDYLTKSDKIPPEKLFYNTDHHWTVPTAFEAFCGVVEYLNENYGYCSDSVTDVILDVDNYNEITMENCYLGSWGRRTGVEFAGLDDFTYYTPDFETDIILRRHNGSESTGAFENVMMNPYRLDKENNGPSDEDRAAGYGENGIYTDLYSGYMDGYVDEFKVINNGIESEKKILIFNDSFGFPFSSFMILSAKESRIIDVRNWDGDIREYIMDFNPDLVLMLYNPDQ